MSYIRLQEILHSLGLKKGEILLVSSNIIRLLQTLKRNENISDPNFIIDILKNLIGDDGTLLFPTYNWDFCKGALFDYYNTPSMTGSLSKIALQRRDFKRTKHPIYSFAVWGKYQDLLCSLDNADSFGPGSPFDFLYQQHGKNLIIDVDYQHCFTFLHYVEESVGVTYRYIKEFKSIYIDECSKSSTKTYSMYVRALELETKNNINPIGDALKEKRISKIYIMNNIPFIIVDLNLAFEIIRDDIINNRSKKVAIYKGQ
jgi:aminoglycoside 3-N-acetyltransferase